MVGIITAAHVDADAADDVVLAIEGAAEVFVAIMVASDGHIVVVACGEAISTVLNVLGQLEVLTAVVVASVHVGSQLVEVCGGFDLVRAGFSAGAVPCPRRRGGEQHHEKGYY